MCLAIPGRLEAITDPDPLMPIGRVTFGGVSRQICLACVPEAVVGDYVLVHVGLAISIIDEARAQTVLADLISVGRLPGGDPAPEGEGGP